LLSVTDISVHYGGVYAVNKVSFDVHDGEVLGIVGPNGSGKSTLLNALSGLAPATGRLEVDGVAIPLNRPGRVRRAGLLRTFQTPQVFTELSCVENVMLAAADRTGLGLLGASLSRPLMWRSERKRIDSAYAALQRVGLADHAARSAAGMAYGQNRQLEIARALAASPRFLAMDEPSAGLNQVETSWLAALIKGFAADGITMLVVDHKIDFLRDICDRMLVLQLGEIIADGRPDEALSTPAVIDAYLGV
jgi:ABC-type branched-subunit amino acid transport system ATPase component